MLESVSKRGELSEDSKNYAKSNSTIKRPTVFLKFLSEFCDNLQK
jgi:hypothetical protein